MICSRIGNWTQAISQICDLELCVESSVTMPLFLWFEIDIWQYTFVWVMLLLDYVYYSVCYTLFLLNCISADDGVKQVNPGIKDYSLQEWRIRASHWGLCSVDSRILQREHTPADNYLSSQFEFRGNLTSSKSSITCYLINWNWVFTSVKPVTLLKSCFCLLLNFL